MNGLGPRQGENGEMQCDAGRLRKKQEEEPDFRLLRMCDRSRVCGDEALKQIG